MRSLHEPFVPRVGGVMSADVAVPEHERELRFYSRVLTTGARPLWRDDLTNDRGLPVIGLGARTEAYSALPLQWMPHVQVADVATSADRALALGGRVLMHDRDERGASRWAVLADPGGAAFGVIPVVPADLAPPDAGDGAPAGCIAWLDLTVAEAEATRDFYAGVVGWTAREEGDGRCADFTMLGGDGRPAAGIRRASGATPLVPAVWMIHLPVGDLAESLRRVEEEGGRVVETVRGADGAPTRAAVVDPVGAFFALAAV